MEALSGVPRIPLRKFEPDTDKIKRNLLEKGVQPTPKIIHTLRKKEIQKHNRKLNKTQTDQAPPPPLHLTEESHFKTLKREYRDFNKEVNSKMGVPTVGNPWERLDSLRLRELAGATTEYAGEKLRREELRELGRVFEARKRDELRWVLEDDLEISEEVLNGEKKVWDPLKRRRGEVEVIQFLVDRLSSTKLAIKDWKLSRIMKQSGLAFTEAQLLRIVDGLGAKRCWQTAMSVVEWVYEDKERGRNKSRFVYTKLMAVLGKARKPDDALSVFNLMRVMIKNFYSDSTLYMIMLDSLTLDHPGKSSYIS